MTGAATSAVGGLSCHRPVAWLGQSVFGGGRPTRALASREWRARPPSGGDPVYGHVASTSWLYLPAIPARRQPLLSVPPDLRFFGHPSPHSHPVGPYSMGGPPSRRVTGGSTVPPRPG